MSIAEKFVSMEYGPAPEDPKEAVAWLERHGRRFELFIGGAWQPPAAGEYFDTVDPSNGEKLAAVAQGSAADVDAAVRAARAASAKVARPHSACSRALSLCPCAPGAKAFPASRGSRNHGQRQAHPREPRHRYSARGAAFLLPRRLGAVAGAGISRIRTVRRRRSDYSVEFSAAHAGVENRAGAGDGKHGGPEARRIYPSHRAGCSQNFARKQDCPRASSTS